MGRPTRLTLVLSLLVANLTTAAGNPSSATIFLNPPIVTGGLKSIATVTLPSPAPAEGVIVHLNASDGTSTSNPNPAESPAATVPPQVTIPAGKTSATFTIDTRPVAGTTRASISAKVGDTPTVAELSVVPPEVARTWLKAGFVRGGQSITGDVMLTGPAPEGGFSVSLTSDNKQIVILPTALTVPAGQSTATFTIQTKQVSSATSVTIAASSPMVTRTFPLRVVP